MFDIGFWELVLIGIIALLVLGPERLPRAARTAGLWLGKARRMIIEMRAEIEHELDMDELNKMNKNLRVRELDEFLDETKTLLKDKEGQSLPPSSERAATPANDEVSDVGRTPAEK